MTAHTAVVFARYMMLSLESREFNDTLLKMFRTMLAENTELSDEKIDELVDSFMNALPALLKTQLQDA